MSKKADLILTGLVKLFRRQTGREPTFDELIKLTNQAKSYTSEKLIQLPFIKELFKKGDVTLGKAPKTTPKDPIDQRWASQEEWAARRKADNKAAIERFENRFGKPEDRASGGRIGYAAGKIVKGAPWVIKNLKRIYVELIEGKGSFANINDLQRESYKWELLADIKKLERGEPIPQEILTNMRKDKRFKDIAKTPSKDPELRELEEVLLDPSSGKNLEQKEILEQFDVTGKKGHASGGIAGQLHLNQGGRVRFDNGGFNKGRRNFLKLMGGLAALPIVGKFFKLAKPATKVMTAVEKSNAAGMPAWFPKLVDKVMQEGKDVSKQYATTERVVVKEVELPGSKTKVIVDQDLTTGDTVVDIGYGKHGFESGRYGQPVRLHLQKGEWIEPEISKTGKVKKKKAVKTRDEFDVEEAEFTGEAENIKYEESVVEKYGNHGSDFSEIEKYATGKNVDKKVVGSKRVKDSWAEGYAEAQADRWADDFAKGGLAGVLRL